MALSFDKNSAEKKTNAMPSEASLKGGIAATDVTGSVAGNTSMNVSAAAPLNKKFNNSTEVKASDPSIVKNSQKKTTSAGTTSLKRDLRAVSNIH